MKFQAKKKADPRSKHPGKNTKDKSKSKSKSYNETAKDNDRKPIPNVEAMPSRADSAWSKMTAPRKGAY